MAPIRYSLATETLTPFLYPSLCHPSVSVRDITNKFCRIIKQSSCRPVSTAQQPSTSQPHNLASTPPLSPAREQHLNPTPSSYSATPFTDRCTVNIVAGNGGHGCVSFLREKYIEEGPASGGDGGSGGSVFIQAVRGETSLHKLARRGILKAGRGRNGSGKAQGGERGEDVVFTVPVGTVVREVWRDDPFEEEASSGRRKRLSGGVGQEAGAAGRDKWIQYGGTMSKRELWDNDLPRLPKYRGSAMRAAQAAAPIRLDLDTPMERPMLLAAGALGGLGNMHFVTKLKGRPKYATKGDIGMKLTLELELKMLADVGLVGLPNAGKSTLLRALSNSRTRVGNWAFTTLQPSVGTVVLDDHKGRPALRAFEHSGEPRTQFTVADIPGLIEDAHLDKGLGLGFLRHIERAAILAFVIDLSAGDAVEALKALWKEVGEYESLRNRELNTETQIRLADERLEGLSQSSPSLPTPISSKPWFVAATKADLPETQANFASLQTYISLLKDGKLDHPSERENAWKKGAVAVPISAIRGEGIERIPRLVVDLLG